MPVLELVVFQSVVVQSAPGMFPLAAARLRFGPYGVYDDRARGVLGDRVFAARFHVLPRPVLGQGPPGQRVSGVRDPGFGQGDCVARFSGRVLDGAGPAVGVVPDGHGGRFCRPASVGPFGDLSGHLGFAERVEPFDDPVRGHIMRFGCGVPVVGSGIAVRVRVGQPIPPLFGHIKALAFEQLVDDRQVGFRRGHVLRVELGLGKDLGDVVVLGGGERGFDLVGRLLHGLGLLVDQRGVEAFLEVVAAADEDDAAHAGLVDSRRL